MCEWPGSTDFKSRESIHRTRSSEHPQANICLGLRAGASKREFTPSQILQVPFHPHHLERLLPTRSTLVLIPSLRELVARQPT